MASGVRSINKGSEEIFDHNCDVCKTDGITSEGISFCTVCNEYLCQRCERSHRGSKASKDHTLVSSSAGRSGSTQRKVMHQVMYCETHKSSIVESFCCDHKQVICSMCKMINHTQCQAVHVSQCVKKEQYKVGDTLKAEMKNLTDLTDEFNNLQTLGQTDKSSMKVQIQACLREMKKIRKNVDHKMEHLEKKMAAELQKLENDLSKKIEGHEAMIKHALSQLSDLTKSLNDCQKSQEDDVMFVGTSKVSSRKAEFDKILTTLKNDTSPIDIRLEPNELLMDMIEQLDSLGSLVIDKQNATNNRHPKSLLNIVVGERKETTLESNYGEGCVFMADGHLVVACDNGLKLFDKDCRYKSELRTTSSDVAVIDDSSVIVTQGSVKQLQYVRVLPDMKVVRTVTMDRWCLGVDVCGDKLYVGCNNGYINGAEVQVLTMDGKVLRRLGVDNGKYMFTWPRYVKVSKAGDKVFVSDYDTNTITCLSTQGRTLYKYTDTDLKLPFGMYVDETDNLLVCGNGSHNIHVVRHDGNRDRILLTNNDGIKCPKGIAYRPIDGCLAVLSKGSKGSILVTFTSRIELSSACY